MLEAKLDYLKNYNGKAITIMEVCGSHTAAIVKSGIKSILSEKIHLIGGPGCPVCVTPSTYIDKLIEIGSLDNTCVVSFGDMLRVPGSGISLKDSKALVKMVYSPMDILELAQNNPNITYVFAAVGFETTAPIYTLLIDEATKRGLHNTKLFTCLKTMPSAINWLLDNNANIDGFIAPGHVCAVMGSNYFDAIAKTRNVPFAVTGFKEEELIDGIYGLVRQIEKGENIVNNYYPSVVTSLGNEIAINQLNKYFEKCDATWRGMGIIKESGLKIRKEYEQFDYGSDQLLEDKKKNKSCHCAQILMGKEQPTDCPLFRKVCTPQNPQGACMVSYEGSCNQYYE